MATAPQIKLRAEDYETLVRGALYRQIAQYQRDWLFKMRMIMKTEDALTEIHEMVRTAKRRLGIDPGPTRRQVRQVFNWDRRHGRAS